MLKLISRVDVSDYFGGDCVLCERKCLAPEENSPMKTVRAKMYSDEYYRHRQNAVIFLHGYNKR